jgi:hypothetical protein
MWPLIGDEHFACGIRPMDTGFHRLAQRVVEGDLRLQWESVFTVAA